MARATTPPAGAFRLGSGCALAWAASACILVAPVAFAGETTAPISAGFELERTDRGTFERASGTVTFAPAGTVCVDVVAPTHQQMLLSKKEVVIYYPERDLALVADIGNGQPPPALDALAAGVVDPASTLPRRSRLVDRRVADGQLHTRWRVVNDRGEDLGEMRIRELRDGAASVELWSREGRLQRRFSFARRVRVGAQTVPSETFAEYFDAEGRAHRQERWRLKDVAARPAAMSSVESCARRGPKTAVQRILW